MFDDKAVLFANEAFYRAFHDHDIPAMEDVWATDGPLACIHPGWPAIVGRPDVMESWRGILGSRQAPLVRCRQPRAFVCGDFAFVVCYEEIAGDFLIATNVFRRQGRRWAMVHHHAAPSPVPLVADEADQEPRPN
jgi:hypothetical protein